MTRRLAPFSLSLLGCLVGCSAISISPQTPVAELAPEPAFELASEPAPIEVMAFETSRGVSEYGGVINGTVRNTMNGEPIVDAIVELSCSCLDAVRDRVTNARGIYSFVDLPPGHYTIRVLTGEANIAKVMELPLGAKFRANFALDPKDDEVRVVEVDALPIPKGTTSNAIRIGMEEAKKLPVGSSTARDFTAVVDMAPTATRDAAGLSLAGTTGAESAYVIDGANVNASAGTLTVATIDDNLERRSLADLAARLGEIPELASRGGSAALTDDRTVLHVVDRRGRPVSGATIESNSGQHRSTLRTGTDGKAVLVPEWDLDATQGKLMLHVGKGEVEHDVELKIGDRSKTIVLPIDHDPTVQTLDLALVIDVTGSMGDELTWLQVELHHMIEKVLAEHPKVDARLAIIAYRDHGDQFEVVHLDFTDDLGQVDQFLADLRADGGGDYPELMDAALAATDDLSWRQADGAKVALLLADAPPHPDRIDDLLRASDGLRETGVSTYALAASGTDSQTELLMRSIAALSGAQYLSLTDDSGIGNAHAEPHVAEYTVETLESALLRILRAELGGKSAAPAMIGERRRRAHTVWDLERSLFDDAGQRELFGGPAIVHELM